MTQVTTLHTPRRRQSVFNSIILITTALLGSAGCVHLEDVINDGDNEGGGPPASKYELQLWISGMPYKENLTFANNGSQTTLNVGGYYHLYNFPPQPAGTPYDVTIVTPPPSAPFCTVSKPTGVIPEEDIVLMVQCSPEPLYTIEGTITGLTGKNGFLISDFEDIRLKPGQTSFKLDSVKTAGQDYEILLALQPKGQRCTLTNGSGTILNANITNIELNCTSSANQLQVNSATPIDSTHTRKFYASDFRYWAYEIDPTTLQVGFWGEVDPTSASNPANYQIPGLTIVNAVSTGWGTTLTTSEQIPDEFYSLTVSNVMTKALDMEAIPDNGLPNAFFSGWNFDSKTSTGGKFAYVNFTGPVACSILSNPNNYEIDGKTPLVADPSAYGPCSTAGTSVKLTFAEKFDSKPHTITLKNIVLHNGPTPLARTSYEFTSKLYSMSSGNTYTPTDELKLLSTLGDVCSNQDATTVLLFFTKELDETSAEDLANYSIPGLTIDSVMAFGGVVRLTLAAPMVPHVLYTVSVSNIKNKDETKTVEPASATFIGFGAPQFVRISVLSATRLRLAFTMPLDPTTAEDPTSYVIPGATVVSATLETTLCSSVDHSCVSLVVSGLTRGQRYELDASKVKSSTGDDLWTGFSGYVEVEFSETASRTDSDIKHEVYSGSGAGLASCNIHKPAPRENTYHFRGSQWAPYRVGYKPPGTYPLLINATNSAIDLDLPEELRTLNNVGFNYTVD